MASDFAQDSQPHSEGLRTWQGAVAVVSGGASGIGAALCHTLGRAGATVVVADIHHEGAEATAAAIRAEGGTAVAAAVDVRECELVEKLITQTVDEYGRIDYLFNNAGVGVGGDVHGCDDAGWRQLLDVNIGGVVHGIQAAYPVMIRQGFGHIVNTASMAGLMTTPGATGYGATKHAIVGLSRSLRIEAAEYGVRVSVLCPGVIRTPILEQSGRYGKELVLLPPDQQQELLDRLRPMEADRFAAKALRAVARNRSVIIVPGWWRMLWWLDRLSPALGSTLSGWGYRSMIRRLVAAAGEDATVSDMGTGLTGSEHRSAETVVGENGDGTTLPHDESSGESQQIPASR